MKTMDFAEEMFPLYTYNPSEYESRETHISKGGGRHTFKNCLCILSLSLDAHKIENIQKQFLDTYSKMRQSRHNGWHFQRVLVTSEFSSHTKGGAGWVPAGGCSSVLGTILT